MGFDYFFVQEIGLLGIYVFCVFLVKFYVNIKVLRNVL